MFVGMSLSSVVVWVVLSGTAGSANQPFFGQAPNVTKVQVHTSRDNQKWILEAN